MTQGRATTSTTGSTKVEPMSQAVNVGAVSEIGEQVMYPYGKAPTLFEGSGLKAPMAGSTCHKGGSQGEY